jgi:hypothetical protein
LNTHGITDYSDVIKGERRNHDHAVRFDVTDGFVGITQYSDTPVGRVGDRVLLSPVQWRALVEFVGRRHPRRVRSSRSETHTRR